MIVKAQPFSSPSAGCSPAAPVPCPIGPPTPSPTCCTPSASPQPAVCQPCPVGPPGPAGDDSCCAADTALLVAINDKIADLMRILDALSILQAIALALQQSGQDIDLAGIEATLAEISAKLDTLSAIFSELSALHTDLSVLHTDNLTQEAILNAINANLASIDVGIDLLHVDNLVIEAKLDLIAAKLDLVIAGIDLLHADNLVIESKLDILHEDNLNAADASERMLDVLERIEQQLSFLTEVETMETKC